MNFSNETVKFEEVINTFFISFDNVGSSISHHGKGISSYKTVVKLSYALMGNDFSGIKIKENSNVKSMIRRAEKLGKLIGKKVSSIHTMNNQGYEYPHFFIKMEDIKL